MAACCSWSWKTKFLASPANSGQTTSSSTSNLWKRNSAITLHPVLPDPSAKPPPGTSANIAICHSTRTDKNMLLRLSNQQMSRDLLALNPKQTTSVTLSPSLKAKLRCVVKKPTSFHSPCKLPNHALLDVRDRSRRRCSAIVIKWVRVLDSWLDNQQWTTTGVT